MARIENLRWLFVQTNSYLWRNVDIKLLNKGTRYMSLNVVDAKYSTLKQLLDF